MPHPVGVLTKIHIVYSLYDFACRFKVKKHRKNVVYKDNVYIVTIKQPLVAFISCCLLMTAILAPFVVGLRCLSKPV